MGNKSIHPGMKKSVFSLNKKCPRNKLDGLIYCLHSSPVSVKPLFGQIKIRALMGELPIRGMVVE